MMKIYKYRDLSNPAEDDFHRLQAILRNQVWCAKPDTLNDPQELKWEYDYTVTPQTLDLLTEMLIKVCDRARDQARYTAMVAIQTKKLKEIVEPDFRRMIEQCRDELGLACFGSTPNNETLWQRYGGNGAGVCVEFEVPSDLLGTQLRWVQYPNRKCLHVDDVMRAYVYGGRYLQLVYDTALLSKSKDWKPEEEIRFVSQRHSIVVAIDRARVCRVFLGDLLSTDVRERIQQIAPPILCVSR